MDKSYRDQVLIQHPENQHVNDKTWQTYVVMNDFREHNDDVPFILVTFSGKLSCLTWVTSTCRLSDTLRTTVIA